jgi:hypothetical protein
MKFRLESVEVLGNTPAILARNCYVYMFVEKRVYAKRLLRSQKLSVSKIPTFVYESVMFCNMKCSNVLILR